jgi:hypothetical protein
MTSELSVPGAPSALTLGGSTAPLSGDFVGRQESAQMYVENKCWSYVMTQSFATNIPPRTLMAKRSRLYR